MYEIVGKSMNKKLLATLFLVSMHFAFCGENAIASGCKTKAITATTKITGTIYNSASGKAIFQAAMNQNLDKWTKAAVRKYGSNYRYHKIKDCVCRVKNIKIKGKNKLTASCNFTAHACNISHYNEGFYRCGLINTKTNKQKTFKFKARKG